LEAELEQLLQLKLSIYVKLEELVVVVVLTAAVAELVVILPIMVETL
jgi:hypothetical protein